MGALIFIGASTSPANTIATRSGPAKRAARGPRGDPGFYSPKQSLDLAGAQFCQRTQNWPC